MNKGIIYLLQPAELVGTNRYKIGCSKTPTLKRCTTGYRCGTRYLCIMECNKPFILEKYIISLFNNKYNKIAGNEYYEIGENTEYALIKLFIDTVYEYIINPNIIYNISNGIIKNKSEDYNNEEIFIIFNLIYLNDKNYFKKYITNAKTNDNYIPSNNIINDFTDDLIDIIFDLNIFKYINEINIDNEFINYIFIENTSQEDEYKCIKLIDYIFPHENIYNATYFDNEYDIENYEYKNRRIDITIDYNDVFKYSDIENIIITNKETEEGYFKFKNNYRENSYNVLYSKEYYGDSQKETLYELIEYNLNNIISNKYNTLITNKLENNRLIDKIFISEYIQKYEIYFNINDIIYQIKENCFKKKINEYKLLPYEYCIRSIQKIRDKPNFGKQDILILDTKSMNCKKFNIDNKIIFYRIGSNFNINQTLNVDIINKLFINVLGEKHTNNYKQFVYKFLNNRDNKNSNLFITNSYDIVSSFRSLVYKLGMSYSYLRPKNRIELHNDLKYIKATINKNKFIRNELLVIEKKTFTLLNEEIIKISNKYNFYNIIILEKIDNNIAKKFNEYIDNNHEELKKEYNNIECINSNTKPDIDQLLYKHELLLNNYLIWCCKS